MQRKLWYIRQAEIFSQLDTVEQEKLAAASTMLSCRRHAPFFLADETSDAVFLVKQGRIKLSRVTEGGREVIIDILGPGEIFGELALAGEVVRSHSAEALDEAMVCIIPRGEFEQLLARHPELALKIMKLIGLRRIELEVRLEDLAFLPLGERLVKTLLRLAKRLGKATGQGGWRLPLTQNDLAQLVGASREAVAEQLRVLRVRGLLRTGYRSLLITEPGRLADDMETTSKVV